MAASTRAKDKPKERPTETVMTMLDIGDFVHTIRAGLKIKQEELARRAHVGRQWLGELEHGKPGLEAAMVLRTLETLGFEITLTPYLPIPPWIVSARREFDRHQNEIQIRRRQRRRFRRENDRVCRRAENATGIFVDLNE